MIAIPQTFAINKNNNKSIYFFFLLTSIIELKHVQMQWHIEGPS